MSVDEAVQIVRDLAEEQDPIDSDRGDCIMCGQDLEGAWEGPYFRGYSVESHDADCVYRRAKEWAFANPNKENST